MQNGHLNYASVFVDTLYCEANLEAIVKLISKEIYFTVNSEYIKRNKILNFLGRQLTVPKKL